mgnify:CR=1 FL=1
MLSARPTCSATVAKGRVASTWLEIGLPATHSLGSTFCSLIRRASNSIGTTDALLNVATSHGADLMVIGRGEMQERLGRLRTRSMEIVGRAGCPVLSV